MKDYFQRLLNVPLVNQLHFTLCLQNDDNQIIKINSTCKKKIKTNKIYVLICVNVLILSCCLKSKLKTDEITTSVK